MAQERIKERAAEQYSYDTSDGVLHTVEEYQEISKHFLAGVNWALREFEELTKDKPRISLNTFLFTLNQDEDCQVILTDFSAPIGRILWGGWKSDIQKYCEQWNTFSSWYVQDFTSIQGGVEICITKELED